MRVACPHCKKTVALPESATPGARFSCPGCQGSFQAPGRAGATASAATPGAAPGAEPAPKPQAPTSGPTPTPTPSPGPTPTPTPTQTQTRPPETRAASGDAPPAPSPEVEAWLRRRLEELRGELKTELLRELLGSDAAGDSDGAGAGRTAALLAVTDDAVAEATAAAVRRLGMRATRCASFEACTTALRSDLPDLVLVGAGLAGDEEGGLALLRHLGSLPGASRRGVFVAFVSNGLQSMDAGSAFMHGADVTVNAADLGRLDEVLASAMAERDKLYATFESVVAGDR